jgi:uncharacterized protein (TIGR00269 family)
MDPGGREIDGFVRRIKPFCDVPERESAMYAYLQNVDFQSLPCPYSSEAMRNDAREFLNRMEVKRPGTKFVVYRTALKLIPDSKRQVEARLCTVCGEPTLGNVCRVCQLLEHI